MTKRPAVLWLGWVLLAALAACLNPLPDEHPTATSREGDPSATKPNGSPSGAPNEGPAFPIGEENDGAQTATPGAVADAGVPAEDAGATSADAGPLVSH
jgi:hypothetical protein